MGYRIQKETPVKVGRSSETARDHIIRAEQRFDEDELVANPDEPPEEDSAPAYWTRNRRYVFQRGESYLVVRSYKVDSEF